MKNRDETEPRMMGEVVDDMWTITSNIAYFDVSTNTFKNELLLTERTLDLTTVSELTSDSKYGSNRFESIRLAFKKNFATDSDIIVSVNGTVTETDDEDTKESSDSSNDSTTTIGDIFASERIIHYDPEDIF